jgi:hypothetical protein
MEYILTTQISENNLNCDFMLFVPECYTMSDKLYNYNIHTEDRFQEPEEEKFYESRPNIKKRKRYQIDILYYIFVSKIC